MPQSSNYQQRHLHQTTAQESTSKAEHLLVSHFFLLLHFRFQQKRQVKNMTHNFASSFVWFFDTLYQIKFLPTSLSLSDFKQRTKTKHKTISFFDCCWSVPKPTLTIPQTLWSLGNASWWFPIAAVFSCEIAMSKATLVLISPLHELLPLDKGRLSPFWSGSSPAVRITVCHGIGRNCGRPEEAVESLRW